MTNLKVITPTLPKLLDSAVLEIQTKLATSLTWLDNIYGKTEKQTGLKQDGKTIEVYPSVFRNEEYLSLLPDTHLGNYCFFEFEDGQDLNFRTHQMGYSDEKASGAIVFFFDYSKVYPSDWQSKTIENIKFDFLSAIDSMTLTKSSINIKRVFERQENVFSGYTTNEDRRKFSMRPFGCLKITFDMVLKLKYC